MFENLLYQNTSKLLIEDKNKNMLPNSLLFSGPVGTGKSTPFTLLFLKAQNNVFFLTLFLPKFDFATYSNPIRLVLRRQIFALDIKKQNLHLQMKTQHLPKEKVATDFVNRILKKIGISSLLAGILQVQKSFI